MMLTVPPYWGTVGVFVATVVVGGPLVGGGALVVVLGFSAPPEQAKRPKAVAARMLSMSSAYLFKVLPPLVVPAWLEQH